MAGGAVEAGDVVFLYRPRVGVEEVDDLDDVQRFFAVLRPGSGQNQRALVLGRKRLPDIDRHERAWAFIAKVVEDEAGLGDGAWPAGEGRYAIVRHGGHTHFAYELEVEPDSGKGHELFNLDREGSYIVAVKNPEAPTPPGVGLRDDRRAELPAGLLERFRGRRFVPVETPELLDHEGVELVLIGADDDIAEEFGLTLGGPIDVSVTIRPGMPIYAGNPGVTLELAQSIEAGDPANVSRLELGVHTGTHVDAPCHFVPGAAAADDLPLDPFIGPCTVADATSTPPVIDAAVVERLSLPAGTDRVLLKTPNSELWGRETFVSSFTRLEATGANALIEHGVRLVGIDYLSIGDPEAHRALLAAGVAVVEGLDLRDVEPGPYFVACLPLKVAGSDGAPARAVLWPRL